MRSIPKVFGVPYLLMNGTVVVWSNSKTLQSFSSFEICCSEKWATEETMLLSIEGKFSKNSPSVAKKSVFTQVFLCFKIPESNTASFTSVFPTSITRFIFLNKAIKIQLR